MKSSAQKGFGIALNNANTNENKNLFRIGYNGSNYANIYRQDNGNTGETYQDTSKTYVSNTETVLKVNRINGVYTAYIDDFTHQYNSAPSNPHYVQLESWSTSKTLTYTDFIVKPL